MNGSFRVTIVGAGVAGSLTAIGLLRRWSPTRPLALTLVERSGDYGRGIAYSTPDDQHLLNVVACGMSAYPVETDHFLEWVRGHGHPIDERAFVRRRAFGDYVAHQLSLAEAAAGPGVVVRRDAEAVAIARGVGAPLAVRTGDGDDLAADVVVLATGNSTPAPLPGAAASLDAHPGYLADPWDHARLSALGADDRVLVVGTGLTMVDVALTLGRGDGPRITAVSRSGELPRAHVPGGCETIAPVARPEEGPWTADSLAERVTDAAAACTDWRSAVDSLRPVSQALWRSLPPGEQERFMARHARTWEVHRHRMAPPVAARLEELRESGRLEVRAGTVGSVAPANGGIDAGTADAHAGRAAAASRGAAAAGTAGSDAAASRGGIAVEIDGRIEVFDAVINATGPDLNVRRAGDPLLSSLLDGGLATPGPHDLGLACAPDGSLPGSHGTLYALGALRRGELWETTAVPEIRVQADRIAATIAAAAAPAEVAAA
jgi:uncharacterized NAD(P)/FAD-binding protein YdhS